MSPKAKAKPGERLPYLLAKLKAPRVLERLEQTAERARQEQWPYRSGGFPGTLTPNSCPRS